ncbi:T9SS type A sorting domain-containing protein [Hymenobacter sp. ASUV-10]|uniref:T9SS type A sorting domain-containing protein n=1 Tax=Hymenobacter aranciens TaxID=3063996 RepID=A0ABT9BD00_9BACT|nr:T9SS type A sorting domain-containing protein [Hymenobacter sp. ASUV-10]MDO7874423.1 T9SS type A sorting domain-containing protein [Hymenobacter sp. ASUV-10]
MRTVQLAAPAGLSVFPNPATGRAPLVGAAPNAPVRVFDGLGREVLATTADESGTALLALPVRLTPGVYVLRTGATARRLTVQ